VLFNTRSWTLSSKRQNVLLPDFSWCKGLKRVATCYLLCARQMDVVCGQQEVWSRCDVMNWVSRLRSVHTRTCILMHHLSVFLSLSPKHTPLLIQKAKRDWTNKAARRKTRYQKMILMLQPRRVNVFVRVRVCISDSKLSSSAKGQTTQTTPLTMWS